MSPGDEQKERKRRLDNLEEEIQMLNMFTAFFVIVACAKERRKEEETMAKIEEETFP